MGQSGTVALKSFQSFQVNDGLLAKVVDAVKAGEKEARSSGNVQSFEVFYRGFRQNIAIGKLYIIPAKIADKLEGFPTALLYGCLVKEFGGEEMADLLTQKIGDNEFDEYSDADLANIKDKLFKTPDGKFETLILFAPEWFNKREYVSFKFNKEEAILSALIRHLVFGAYYDPRLSSAFNALMTDVSTDKLNVTDITPKLPFPELSENPLKAFPVLYKVGGNRRRLGLNFKTADAITQEVLNPPEADVLEALDLAMSKALGVKSVDEAGEEHHTEEASQKVPRLAAKMRECTNCNGNGNSDYDTKCKTCGGSGRVKDDPKHDMPREGSSKEACESEHGVPEGVTNVGPGTAAHDAKKNPEVKEKKFNADAAKDHETAQKPIGIELNADGTPKRKTAAHSQIRLANKAQVWLWECELTGQMSDGMWENSAPFNHYKVFDDADVTIGEPGVTNIRPRRTYGFRRLVEYVGDRMLNLGKLAKAYPELETKAEYGYAAEAIMKAKAAKPATASSKKTADAQPNEVVLYNNRDGADKEYRVQINKAGENTGEMLYTVDYKNGKRGKATAGGTKTPRPVSIAQATNIARDLIDEKIKGGYRPSTEGQAVEKTHDLQVDEHSKKYVEALELATGDDRTEIRQKLEQAPYNQGDLMRDLRQIEAVINGAAKRASVAPKTASVIKAHATKVAAHCKVEGYDECPDDGTDYHGRCLGACSECGEHLMSTGRYTVYCPSCNVCPECNCPQADGFDHYQGCSEIQENLGLDDQEDDLMVESSQSWNGQIISKKEASSKHSRDQKKANELKLQKIRGKVADNVPDADDILGEVLSDMGQAPLVDLPNDDGNKNPSQPSPGVAALPESAKSDTPEKEKSVSDGQAQAVPDALENAPTKTEEPKSEPQEPKEEKSEAKTEELKAAASKKFEAYGVKGMSSTKWRKDFNSHEEAEAWADKNDAEIQGFREKEGYHEGSAREKVAAYIKKAKIGIDPAENGDVIVTMNDREYLLSGDAAKKFLAEYNAIPKPLTMINQLVEKYMADLKPFKKPAITVDQQAEELADADNYWAGRGNEPGAGKRYMTQHASRKTASVYSTVIGRNSDWDLGDLTSLVKTAGERNDDVPVSKGEGDNGEQPKSDLTGAAPEAHDVPPQVDSHQAAIAKKAYVAHVPGHKNSQGESAPWVIKQHNTDKILESFKSEQAAKDGLKNMESHKGSKKADAAPVLPGNLKPSESANVNAMREALETQQEMEVGKPIEEKQEEVQNAEDDLGTSEVVGEVNLPNVVEVPKGEGHQVIINIASASSKPITSDTGGQQIDGKTPFISATGDLHSDSAAGSGPCKGCGKSTQADGMGINRCYTPGCSEENLTQDTRKHIGATTPMAPGAAVPRALNIGELQALPIGQQAQFGQYQVMRQKPNFYIVTQNGTQVVSGNSAQVMQRVPQAQAPKAPASGAVASEDKAAGFGGSMYFPDQALREFYPEIQHEIVDYPNANNSPMIEDIDVTNGYDNDIAAAADDALDVTKISYVSTSPAGGIGIGRDGKPEVLEGAPLRKENDIRGPMFTDEFYQNYDAGPDASALSIVSKKVAAADEAKQFAMFLNKVCGEIAATLVAGFKVTSRPLMDKIPGVGEVQLAQVEKAQPGFMNTDMSLVDPASRVKYLLEKLTDSEIQDAINKSFAHAGVWHDETEGGFVYEVFVRGSSIDTDNMVMKYEFVVGTKEGQ